MIVAVACGSRSARFSAESTESDTVLAVLLTLRAIVRSVAKLGDSVWDMDAGTLDVAALMAHPDFMALMEEGGCVRDDSATCGPVGYTINLDPVSRCGSLTIGGILCTQIADGWTSVSLEQVGGAV